eukprot:6836965-Prymnesium_polylepis.1
MLPSLGKTARALQAKRLKVVLPGAATPAPARHHHGATGGTHARAESVWGRSRGTMDRGIEGSWIGGPGDRGPGDRRIGGM